MTCCAERIGFVVSTILTARAWSSPLDFISNHPQNTRHLIVDVYSRGELFLPWGDGEGASGGLLLLQSVEFGFAEGETKAERLVVEFVPAALLGPFDGVMHTVAEKLRGGAT